MSEVDHEELIGLLERGQDLTTDAEEAGTLPGASANPEPATKSFWAIAYIVSLPRCLPFYPRPLT